MKFWNVVKNADTGEPEIHIDGDIQMDKSLWALFFGREEQTATGIREDIKKLDGKDITVWINSNGGECFAASVIYTALREHRGKVTVKIDGTAISAASVIAMAGDEILMSPTSVMMIHNPQTVVGGEVKDMEKAIEILTEVKETILNAYCSKCKLSREEVARLMDEETWMGANKALSMGFADGILYGEEQEPETVNSIISGARMVYNQLPKPKDDLVTLMERLKDAKNQEFEQAKALLDLEKQRF